MRLLYFILVFCTLFVQTLQTEPGSVQQVKLWMKARLPLKSPLRLLIDDDLYASSWLEMSSKNVKVAMKMFDTHLAWRDKNRIDTIHSEDWSSFLEDFPVYSDTFDKTGRPTAEVWFSDWDIRKAVISGRGKQLARWYAYLLDTTQTRLYVTRRSGLNITGAVGIFDFNGFNFFKQGCPACLSQLSLIANIYAQHYLCLYDKIILLNVGAGPQGFIAAKKQFGTLTSKMDVYQRENAWRKHLDVQFTRGNLSERFGGSVRRLAY